MGKQKNYLLLVLKGCAMGAADVVPGVSGGTIAFITGIYEELIDSIKSIDLQALKLLLSLKFADFWKKINGSFLLGVAGGIAISIFSLAKLMTWLLEHHPIYIWSFFFGLIVASSVLVAKEIKHWHIGTVISLIAGGCIAYVITVMSPAETPNTWWFIILSGAIAICAMILPGISGAFILLLYPRSCQQPEHRGDVVIHRRSGCRYHQFFPSVILVFKKISYSDCRYPNGIHGRVSE